MRVHRSLVPLALLSSVLVIPLLSSGCLLGFGGTGGGGQFNAPPTVALTADITRGIAPLTVNFSSAGSTDDSLIVSRQWDFGDGQTSLDISPTHTFRNTGDFTVKLKLTDDDGASASSSLVISVTQAPVAVLKVDRTTAPSAPAIFNFDGSDSSDPDGSIAGYQWDFGDGSREVLPVVVHTFATPGNYRVRLTVTDNTGVTDSADQTIQVGIPQPMIDFRLPPDDIPSVAVAPESPLWVQVVYNVEPGVPRMVRAGLDGDRDPCEAQAALYDTQTGELLQRLTGPADRVTSVAYAPGGALVLSASEDATARLYDPTTGEAFRAPDTDAATAITSVAFSPDGARYVYGATDGSVVVRDTASGAVVREFNSHTVAVNGVAYAPTGAHVASGGDDNRAIVYDVNTGQVVRILTGHTAAVTAVAFSPTNGDLLLTGSLDKTAILWRVQDGTVLRTFAGGHAAAINAVTFTPDAQLALTGSDDQTAKLWSMVGASGSVVRTFSEHTARVTSVAVSPNGQQVLTGSGDGTAILREIATGNLVRTLAPCVSTITSVAFAPDGSRILLGVAARNSLQLDTNPPTGNDMNLTIPTALDLSVLTSDQYPAQYFLWAELDTDRTEPVRAYAGPQIEVVKPFTSTVNQDTPRIPLISDQAVIVVESTTDRQIFDLGPLRRGDRLFLSLLSTPGYGEFYSTNEPFSVLVMDAAQSVFTWYQEGYILFTPNAKLVIGHDSPSYYVVVDGCRPPACGGVTYGQSIAVRMERGVGLVARQQRMFLNFNGGQAISVAGLPPIDIPPFKASDLNPAWVDTPAQNYTQLIKNGIVNRVQTVYAGYNITVLSSDGAPPAPPYQTIYFGGFSFTFFGISSYIDPRNETLTGKSLVATLSIASSYPNLTPEEMALAIGNVAAHEAGHLFGLRHTEGGMSDLMDVMSPITDPSVHLMASPLYRGEQYNGQIGIQDVPQLFGEVIGTGP